MELHPIVAELLRLGVTIEISYDEKGLDYDLKTGAKSHIHARATKGGTLHLRMRYDEEREIETFDELCDAFDSCLNSSGYHNHEWGEAMRKCGHWTSEK
jgi:hypothetical protein